MLQQTRPRLECSQRLVDRNQSCESHPAGAYGDRRMQSGSGDAPPHLPDARPRRKGLCLDCGQIHELDDGHAGGYRLRHDDDPRGTRSAHPRRSDDRGHHDDDDDEDDDDDDDDDDHDDDPRADVGHGCFRRTLLLNREPSCAPHEECHDDDPGGLPRLHRPGDRSVPRVPCCSASDDGARCARAALVLEVFLRPALERPRRSRPAAASGCCGIGPRAAGGSGDYSSAVLRARTSALTGSGNPRALPLPES
eukprot:scaffold2321_cov245-Pinguiococcus_pyrenoidosus.AAC.3